MADDIAVHVIDDDEGVRSSLAFLFDTAGIPARTYGSAVAFLEAVPTLRSGCVLTDVRMPGLDGLALQRRLNELQVRLPVIVMTGHADVPMAVQALKAGAADFIEKPFDDDRLVDAVRAALEANQRGRAREVGAAAIGARIATLTPREREVLDELLSGRSNKAIAQELGMSPRTVEVHRARVMEKMAAESLPELVKLALRAGHGEPAL